MKQKIISIVVIVGLSFGLLYFIVWISHKMAEASQHRAEKYTQKAYDFGEQARFKGVSSEANPYKSTNCRSAWLRGWMDGDIPENKQQEMLER